MHTEMWQNPATVENVRVLRERGVTVVGPTEGQLTGKDSGPGRMSEPGEIVAAALAVLHGGQDLAGRKVLITAGGTREPLDPVRFIGNRSSGKQGIAIARAAAARGADVTLITANLEVEAPAGMRVQHVMSAVELQDVVTEAAPDADVVIMAAAVADYRPEVVADAKIKKEQQGDRLELTLVRNPDILATISADRREGQVIIGFAAETEPDDAKLLELGRAKIARKGCDYLVINRVGWSEGFATERNTIVVVDRAGAIVAEAAGTKSEVADRLLDLLATDS
jgi:phosphopantothenoylcysteine decarboxylase/phosphopantothenate--cysteine ligase